MVALKNVMASEENWKALSTLQVSQSNDVTYKVNLILGQQKVPCL